ncbi:cytochrome P450 [Mycolicibacterium sp. BK556]|uniref:cytochrome P450 n=1 Tax=unclassified Mycolicibacterium TaxID=2636767 RepID=UPI00161055F4|nr:MULTISPECIES: cytochrome P450 [unclassified Mycolicibacterium]MBB3602863.1 cytochrome P450 [Mycolicibacterium sp. BK556]MBB3633058.1 cytochrome P450 [Mycolicibacterium sp. BK607]
MTAVSPPRLAFDTADPAFVRLPWARYEEIRALGGVVFNERVNRWMVSDFAPAKMILTNTELFGSEKGQAEQAGVFGGPTMEFYDGPHHDRIRAIWSHDFRAKDLAALRPMITDVIRRRLEPVLARLESGETVEIVSELTRGIPTEVIARMLGIESAMVDQFSAWSDAMGASAEGYTNPGARGEALIAAGRQATAELNAYLRDEIGRLRDAPDDEPGLIATMVRHQYARSHMTEQEVVAGNTQLVFAGNETTAKLLAQIVATLAEHPDQRRVVHQDRSLIPAATEEVHRYETITHSVFRDVIADDVAVAGVRIPEGARITLLLGAANRDPQRWERAGEFDVSRPKLSHLGYAFGLHSCLGMNLARLEAQIFLEEFLDALPDWQVHTPIDFGTNYAVRGPANVRVSTS